MALRSWIGSLVTSDPDVVAATATVLPVIAVFQVLVPSNARALGILRGAGRSHISGTCNTLACCGVGISLGWVLESQLGWGLVGLWIGIICGSGVLLILLTAFKLTLPWKIIALAASGKWNEMSDIRLAGFLRSSIFCRTGG
ncbi:hypothetical protein LMH87_000908 [Akanthomyces muscarius]|uniref:Uncharacterized protein n=1 Tax=Akanthomyces muscarius TaxID=2231603 RepID=A0A9W8QHS4_AKAMU|nr:hypothetical protein LMH87_000908 [Akanthomyces muscarius]KAJ4155672.1 hypothetical protein LMH87_000908 [Akanthomyces muscarius]